MVVFMVQKRYFPHSHLHSAHLIRVDNKELREKTILLQGELLQTKSLVMSESSKGLQRAGVSSHFLARERGALTFVTRLARGTRRFIFRRLNLACNSSWPLSALSSFPPPPPQALKFSAHLHGSPQAQRTDWNSLEASTCSGSGWGHPEGWEEVAFLC